MDDYPIIKLTISFIAGILLSYIFPNNSILLFISIFLITITAIFFIKKGSSSIILKAVTLIVTFIFGYGLSTYQNQHLASYPLNTEKIRNVEVIAEIKSINLIKDRKLTFEVSLISMNDKRAEFENNKFLCNVWKDTLNNLLPLYQELAIGNKVSFVGNINKPRNQRNPYEFNYENYLSGQGISGIINCYKINTFKIIESNIKLIPNSIFVIRKTIDERIKELYDPVSSALLKGILLADRSDIDYDTRTTFVNSGVIHVLAVSGLHVGFIIIIFYLLLGRVDLRVKYMITIAGIILFLIITGGHASVFRASTMAIVYLLAKLSNRSTNGFNSIAFAGMIILVVSPRELFNPGFQLSFSAVLSILIIYPILSEKINKLNIPKLFKSILLFISVSLAAQLGTLPFTLMYFNKLSLVSLIANIIVIPTIGIIVAIGIISLTVSLISIWTASIFAYFNSIIISILYGLIAYFSSVPLSHLEIFSFSIIDSIIFYLELTFVVYTIKNFNKYISLIIIPMVIITMVNLFQLDNNSILPEGELSICTIDVGQGDAFLVKFPNNKTALIDAGNRTEYFDNGERIIHPLLQNLEIDTIDYAFISHLDSDHFAGILSLVELGIIKEVYKPWDFNSIEDSIFNEFLNANNVVSRYYQKDILDFGSCRVYILNDTTNIYCKNFDSNNNSGIIKILYGNTSFLFVGDAEIEAENILVKTYGHFLKSDVLKVGHHGSKTSTSEEFLSMVKPKIGIISAGILNKFKHPSKSTLEKLEKWNVEILRTDKLGAIILASNGNEIRKINWKN